jgi:hypothetical protein
MKTKLADDEGHFQWTHVLTRGKLIQDNRAGDMVAEMHCLPSHLTIFVNAARSHKSIGGAAAWRPLHKAAGGTCGVVPGVACHPLPR